jgi:hypothetical protein
MSDDFTSKTGKSPDKLRIDHEQGLVFIPGKDEPQELIAPMVQRTDPKTGLPYQHVVTAGELIEGKEQHERCMRFVRNAMQARWRCTQCQEIRPGTELRVSGSMMDLLRGMLQPGGVRVDWGSIVEHLASHLRCKNPKCDAPCRPVQAGETV